jgi:hypothetical protein
MPTSTPAPTSGPVATPTPLPDLSKAVLTAADFPPGFEQVPFDLGSTSQDASGGAFTTDSTFAFVEAQRFEIVIGFTTLLPNRLQQAGFDGTLDQPEMLATWISVGMGADNLRDQKVLTDLGKIGDASVGLTSVVDMGGIAMRMDLLIFRRGVAGAYVIAIYIEGDAPVVSIGELGSKLDARIVQVLGSGT